jgi:8-oxo-dGTP diphosphatase
MTDRSMADIVDVAVGILIRADGRFLMGQRPAGKPMPGYWEFSGGKLESGEAVRDALVREFQEELDITITEAYPWFTRRHVYAHATVRLHFWRAFAWSGEPRALEGQALRWERSAELLVEPWLPGALPLKRWLDLPDWYALSDVASHGVPGFLARVDDALLSGALRMLLLREPDLDGTDFEAVLRELRPRCLAHGARLLVSSRHPERYWDRVDGVHLTAADALRLARRPAVGWCAASAHNAPELVHAGELGVDFAVLGAVAATPSHPVGAPLGWSAFTELLAHAQVPVYALGGLGHADRARARESGAQGIAALRASWQSLVSR